MYWYKEMNDIRGQINSLETDHIAFMYWYFLGVARRKRETDKPLDTTLSQPRPAQYRAQNSTHKINIPFIGNAP